MNEVSEIVNEGHRFALMNVQRMSAKKVHEVAGTMADSLRKVGII
jgi:hypothetical protein